MKDYSGMQFTQQCGDILIVTKKSSFKVRNRYYWEGHFEGYSKIIKFRIDSAISGNIHNPEKPDEFGFLCDEIECNKHIYCRWKDIERRCYDSKCASFANYGAKGVTVSEEFKKYSSFKNWYLEHWDGNEDYEVDKDCKSLETSKIYSSDTCILIPSAINSFISTLGKGIYKTKYNTYNVRLRRKFLKENKNFKSFEEAVSYKKEKDLEYLDILLSQYNINEEIKNLLTNYVKVFKYSSDIARNT